MTATKWRMTRVPVIENLQSPDAEAIELGLVTRFFERLGDHAVNVTRRPEFLEPVPEPC